MKNISNIIEDMNESQANKLRVSRRRKHPSPQIQIYDQLRNSIQLDCQKSYTIKPKILIQTQERKLFEYKNQKDLEHLVYLITQPCTHEQGCLHEQLFDKNQLGKTFRQVCEFRIDWQKRIKKSEIHFEKSLAKKKCQQTQVQSNEQFTILILEAIYHKVSALNMIIEKSKQEPRFFEYAKRFALQFRQRMDYSESLLCQFEDVQNRKKYAQPPSFWDILDCSCHTTVL